jgi:hypothetical protein
MPDAYQAMRRRHVARCRSHRFAQELGNPGHVNLSASMPMVECRNNIDVAAQN